MPFDAIINEFKKGLEKAVSSRRSPEVRIGAELKFPLVGPDGASVEIDKVRLLWDFLEEKGWRKDIDPLAGEPVGCRTAGEQNDTVASTETGYSKTEFSMAHEPDLFRLDSSIRELSALLREFSDRNGVFFLCFGIHPVSAPCRRLMVKKTRTSVWDKIFKSNNRVPECEGDDMHLFTLNAASHVHLGLPAENMLALVNALNGFSGAQIALNAHSNIWRGVVDPDYKCVAEKFWDWWVSEKNRTGVPERPFSSLEDYAETVSALKPVYVKRSGMPVLITGYGSFGEYYASESASGIDLEGNSVILKPEPEDIKLHNTLYWYNTRVSGYYTVENRVNDQQPPGELLAPSALTLGIACALEESAETLSSYEWESLRQMREIACSRALEDEKTRELAGSMLAAAREGLRRRGKGEEVFLEPLFQRLKKRKSPADEAEGIFSKGDISELIRSRKL